MAPRRRRRLERVLVDRGLAGSVTEAHELIDGDRVTVDGAPAVSAARLVAPHEAVLVTSPRRFVGRGGEKLASALEAFELDVSGLTVLDVGASTGGFTDCLLRCGAGRVIAVDVGTHQLHERLRADPRVVSIERTDIRAVGFDALPARPDLAVGDVSFISVDRVLEHVVTLIAADAVVCWLVKPQFEVDHRDASAGSGVIRRPELWRVALTRAFDAADRVGRSVTAATVSPMTGARGNTEFFVLMGPGRASSGRAERLIDAAIDEAVLARAGERNPS